MKISLTFIAFIFLTASLFGQNKNDYNWLLGYGNNDPDEGFGGTALNFHNESENPEVNFFEIPFDFLANTVCSDKDGNLAFYSNGCQIANKNHEIMENGSSINEGTVYDTYCENGYPSVQAVLSLPLPKNDSIYYLFHIKRDDNNIGVNRELLNTVININGNEGNGIIESKNELILEDTFTEELTAVRHGNGRDWWIILPRRLSNTVFVFLFNPSGIHFSHEQTIGTPWEQAAQIGQAVFSPDGTKFIRANVRDNIHIYNFDRCTGMFDNPIHFDIPADTITIGSVGCAISPNSRFLYISASIKIHQYDLFALDIESSKITVGEYDGYQSPFPTIPYQGMLAPNGKIYMTSTNGTNVLHVIHNPNEKGLDCNFENHGLQMPTYNGFIIPNFPHFRLYDMPDSPCDTLGIDIPVSVEEAPIAAIEPLKIYPNPAQATVFIDFSAAFSGNLTVTDMTGKVVLQKTALQESTQISLSLEGLSNGLYQVTANNTLTGEISQQKVVVQK